MSEQTAHEEAPSSGVDVLIARLRDEGVTAGRSEADKITSDARAEAKRMLDKAKAEAQQHLDSSRKEADTYRNAGEEALKTAMRDTILDMKTTLMERFSADVKRLMSHQLKDQEFLKQMILEVAGRARDDAELSEGEAVEIVLPEEVIGLEELRGNPEELQKGPLTKFVMGMTSEMLREGVSFSGSEDVKAGIRLQLKEKDMILDLTEEAVAGLLLQHLQPRFRAILEGIVK